MNPFATLPSYSRFFGFRKTTSRRRPCTAIERAVSTVVERLESRQLLSSSILVNSTLDNVSDASVSGSIVTLREAVNYENANGGGTITFAPGLTATGAATITLTQTGDGTAGPSALGIASNITIQGPTSGNGITIAGNGSQRLFYVAAGGTLALNDLTLTGGNATGGSSYSGGGGAGLGGAIFSQGTVNVYQSTLAGNSAVGGNGGDNNYAFGGAGMGAPGGNPNGGGPNGGGPGQNGGFGGGGGGRDAASIPSAGSGGFGGGGGGGPSDSNGGFGGGGGGGGGGSNRGIIDGGFGGGSSSGVGGAGGGMGGAIFNAAGSLSIIDSTFTANTATGGNDLGGGRVFGSGYGGAVFNLNGSLTLTGDTFAADAVAPGFNPNYPSYIGSADGTDVYTLGLANVVAYVGGPNIGSANGTSSATLTDDLFANGTGGADLVVNNSSGNSTVTGSNNLDTGSTGLPAGVSTTTTSAALKLGALTNNGGTTQTIPLLAGSSAIGAGVIVSGVATDQRGYGFTTTPSAVDIGAYQSAAIAPETPGLFVNTTADATNAFDGVTSLREAIAYADSLGGGTITFASNLAGQTITLGGSQLELTATANPVVIDAAPIGGIAISGNNASRVFLVDSGATVTLNGLTIVNGLSGVGTRQIIGGGGIANLGTLTATNDTITGNTANYGPGGGIINNGVLTATNDTISGNTANFGGGIFNGGTLTANNVTIAGNKGNGEKGSGGGIENSGTFNATNVTITGNISTAGGGGGIFNYGVVTATNDSISNNISRSNGGGIYTFDGTVTATNVTIANNTASGDGIGIFIRSGSFTAAFVTVANNTTSYGSGIYVASSGTLTLNDSIDANPGSTSDLGSNVGSTISGSNDLIGDGNFPVSLTNTTSGDPKLGPLANNGGATQTMALLPNSPAIGAGVAVAGVTTDQRGVVRSTTAPSIGAYEFVPTIAPTISTPVINAVAGIPVSATATFTDGSGNPLAGLTGITVSFSGGSGLAPLTGLSTNAAGQLTISTTFPNVGSAGTYTVSFPGSPSFMTTSASNALNVRLCNTQFSSVSAPSGTLLVGNTLTFSAVLRANEPNDTAAAQGETVWFTVTDPTGGASSYSGTATTDATGSATYSFIPSMRGAYSITVSSVDDATFAGSSSGTVNVAVYQKAQLAFTSTTVTATESDTTGPTVTVALTAPTSGTPLSASNVLFFANVPWMAGGVAATSVSGNTASYTFPSGFSGTFNVTAKITAANAAANYYVTSTGASGVDVVTATPATLTINPATASLATVSVSATPTLGVPVTLNTVLTRTSAPSGALANQVVTFAEKGPGGQVTTQTAFTAADGSVSVQYTPTTLGAYSVVANFTSALPYLGSPAIGAPYSSVTSATTTVQVAEVPSLFVTTKQDVVNPTDNLTSLREAIAYADSLGGGTVTFAPSLAGQTITLGGSHLELTATSNPVNIDASGIGGITISGNNASRVFKVDSGATVTLNGLTVINGAAINDLGGGIYNAGTLTATNDTIASNSATYGGGGIYNVGKLTATNDTISGNSAAEGGGICNDYTAIMTAANNTIVSNSGSNAGGGISNSGTLMMTSDTIANNSASRFGGGISNSGTLTSVNDTIVSNSSGNLGGGISNYAAMTLTNDTVVNNSASDGGGIWNAVNQGRGSSGPVPLTVSNTLVVGNNSPGLPDLSGTVINRGGNLIGLPASYTLGQVINIDSNGKPLLSNNGGPTQTIALAAGSPAINAGINLLAVDANGNALTTDQRGTGYARIVGGTVDIGAYESPVVSTTTTVSDAGGTYNANPFTAAGSTTISGSTAVAGTPTFTYYLASDTGFTRPLTGAPTNAGNYVVVASFAAQGNYLASSSSTSFSITPAAPTVTAIDSSGPYNGNPFAASSTVTDLTGNPLSTGGVTYIYYTVPGGDPTRLPRIGVSTPPTDAGNYAVVAHYPGSTDGNYAATDSRPPTYFTIAQVSPTISIAAPNKVYTGSVYAPTISVTGLGGANLGTPTVQYFLRSDPSQLSPIAAPTVVGAYTVVVTYAGSTDYASATQSANFNITQASPSITSVNPVNITYGTALTNSQLTGTTSTPGSFSYTTASGTKPKAGNGQTVSVTFTPTDSLNYISTTSTVVVNVAKATPTLSVTAGGGTYSGSVIGATATITDVKNVTGPTLESIGLTLAYYAGSNATGTPLSGAPTVAGTYTVVAAFAGSTNYAAVSTVPVTFTIAKFKPAIGTVVSGGPYTGSPFAGAAYLIGVAGYGTLNLENVTPTQTYYAGSTATGTPLSGAPTAAGTYTVVSNFAGSADYNSVVSTPTTFIISKASPTLNLSAAGGVYNAAASNATATVTGISGPAASNLEGVTPTLTYFSGSTATGTPLSAPPINVGTYTVVENFAGSANYSAAAVSKTFSITQAGSTISVPTVTVAYGGTASLSATLTTSGGAILANRTITFTFNGKVIGTALTNASGVATLSASAAGINPGVISAGVQASFAGDANSTATSTSNSLTVTDAAIVAKGTTLSLLNIALTLGTFTQARTGTDAGDYVVTVNWGDGSALQQATVVADLFHPGQFNIVGPLHLYKKLFTTYAVTVTISTAAKFGASAGATTTFTTSILA